MSTWQTLCALEDIIPGSGLCALVNDEQVALFRPNHEDQIFALNNFDPFAKANVLSRGIICQHKDELWVASPLKKQRFRLTDGLCMEDERFSVKSYSVRVTNGMVEVES